MTKHKLPSNEQIFKDFILEQKVEALTVEWVVWMLDLLYNENSRGVKINPRWLRAGSAILLAGHDPHTTEPAMIYKCHD